MDMQRKVPPIKVNAEKCVGCLSCELRCSFRRVKAFSPADSDIRIKRLVGAKVEYQISFTENCDACGICVLHCTYGALTQDKSEQEIALDV